jgi:hypothetical protein
MSGVRVSFNSIVMNEIDIIIIEKRAQVSILKAISCQLCSCEGAGYVLTVANQIEKELNDAYEFKKLSNDSSDSSRSD